MAQVGTQDRAHARPQPRVCAVASTLEIVGEKWALLAIREVFLGTRRFDEMLANIGCPRDTLATRLRTLVDNDILAKRRYSERPPRDEYVLTQAGRDIYPVILTLRQWGNDHLQFPQGSPLMLTHECGSDLDVELVCKACGGEVHARSVKKEFVE